MGDTIIQILLAALGIIVCIIGALLYRLIAGYDKAVDDLYTKCNDTIAKVLANQKDLEWLKKEWNGKGKSSSGSG